MGCLCNRNRASAMKNYEININGIIILDASVDDNGNLSINGATDGWGYSAAIDKIKIEEVK